MKLQITLRAWGRDLRARAGTAGDPVCKVGDPACEEDCAQGVSFYFELTTNLHLSHKILTVQSITVEHIIVVDVKSQFHSRAEQMRSFR